MEMRWQGMEAEFFAVRSNELEKPWGRRREQACIG
jgi:hypothetical protein